MGYEGQGDRDPDMGVCVKSVHELTGGHSGPTRCQDTRGMEKDRRDGRASGTLVRHRRAGRTPEVRSVVWGGVGGDPEVSVVTGDGSEDGGNVVRPVERSEESTGVSGATGGDVQPGRRRDKGRKEGTF